MKHCKKEVVARGTAMAGSYRLITLLLAILWTMPAIAGVQLTSNENGAPLSGPRLVLWSWEHNDNLSFIDPNKVAVAYYAGTIVLGRDIATLQKRKNHLHVPGRTVCFPAFRIENAHPGREISDGAFAAARNIITEYVKRTKSKQVQIDFDATLRDRKSYLHFLQGLGKDLPDHTFISITTLASWCLYDKWLQKAPVNETVAMMFSLGRDRQDTLQALAQRRLDSGAHCAQSMGIAVYEQKTNHALRQRNCMTSANRIYAFSALGWTKSRYEQVFTEVNRP